VTLAGKLPFGYGDADMRHWIERAAAALTRKPGLHLAAFSSLRAVSERGLEAFDGVRLVKVPWTSVKRITAAMGQQQYDMTQILWINHSAGRSIFLSEVEALWAPFITGMMVDLQGALPTDEWIPHLSANPKANIRVYSRPGCLL
jgi:hypothetical protein